MRNFLIFSISVILCYIGSGQRQGFVKSFVAFGSDAVPDKWHWIAAMLIKDQGKFYQSCGGSLLSDQHILTAAHCFTVNGTSMNSTSFIIRLGQYNLGVEGQDFRIDKIITHPDFDNKTFKNDIAIMKLAKKVNFTDEIRPINIPLNGRKQKFCNENGNEVAYIAGWGRTSFGGEFSDELQEALLHIVPQTECRNVMRKYSNITKQFICAGAPKTSKRPSDACGGDSGGPLVQLDECDQEYYLTGIISFGKKCATHGLPGVYTRVQYYTKWILETIRNNS